MTTAFLLLSHLMLMTTPPPQLKPDQKMVGMYIHQHWPYNHPYAARTWTVQDWRGYATGLKAIGYNTILFWPMMETMPNPLTPSDKAYLGRMKSVVDMLHRELGMRVYLCLCPNVGAKNVEAAKTPFEKRHFFYTDMRVNPADSAAIDRLVSWREELLRPVKNLDGIVIIDSDPGGYPGSTNQQFVDLLVKHRKMFDRLRPGIELAYWMHAGWEAYGNYYRDGHLVLGSDAEHIDCLKRLIAANPEPWGVANGYAYAKQLGVDYKVISFNYGRIEGEPSFPLTNFTGAVAYEGGGLPGPRGVMGNSQTHCVQLPNTFAFARGALGQPVNEGAYLAFAEQLLPGWGDRVLAGWTAMASVDAKVQVAAADRLEAIPSAQLKGGPLKGLLFGSPQRFVHDLVLMLRYSAALNTFADDSEAGRSVTASFRKFLTAAEAWQKTHGYENAWYLGRAHAAIAKLGHPDIRKCLERHGYEISAADPRPQDSNFQRVSDNLAWTESFTVRLLAAMRKAADGMK